MQLGVNYNTVNKVYQDLERDGYIYTQRGRGTYVSDLKNAHLSVVDGDVEALAVDFCQQALTAGMSAEDIHDLVSEQLILLGGVASTSSRGRRVRSKAKQAREAEQVPARVEALTGSMAAPTAKKDVA